MHFVFYFRSLIVNYSVYLQWNLHCFLGSSWFQGSQKAILHHKLVLQLYCPQGNHLRHQQSPSAATDASPPSVNKNRIGKAQGTCGWDSTSAAMTRIYINHGLGNTQFILFRLRKDKAWHVTESWLLSCLPKGLRIFFFAAQDLATSSWMG